MSRTAQGSPSTGGPVASRPPPAPARRCPSPAGPPRTRRSPRCTVARCPGAVNRGRGKHRRPPPRTRGRHRRHPGRAARRRRRGELSLHAPGDGRAAGRYEVAATGGATCCSSGRAHHPRKDLRASDGQPPRGGGPPSPAVRGSRRPSMRPPPRVGKRALGEAPTRSRYPAGPNPLPVYPFRGTPPPPATDDHQLCTGPDESKRGAQR
jgi:hypothetical protein